MLMRHGHLDAIKGGPVFWVDCADSQPCVGTAAAIQWKLRAVGKLFHSGLPHKGINAYELANEALRAIQARFYADFPAHASEEEYGFACASTLKPTRVAIAEGSVNQIPAWTEIQGDIRLTPFYSVVECQAKVDQYVAELKADVTQLPVRGPASKYVLGEENGGPLAGTLEWSWEGEPFKGIACKLDSRGLAALKRATASVLGTVKPYSICGSLPLVGDMQEAGFDIQLCGVSMRVVPSPADTAFHLPLCAGYGKSSVYHGDDEFCSLTDMANAMRILTTVIGDLDAQERAQQ